MKSNRAVADWETRELSQIARIETGGTPPTSDRSLYGNDFPFASPADIGAQRWIASTEKNLSSAGWNHVRRLPAGAILVVCIGSTIGKVGMAAVPMATNQQINAVIPSDKIDRDFLYYSLCLSADEIRGQASEQAVPIINKSTFGRLSIFIPPLHEQQAIAAALSDADGMVAGLERGIAKKRLIKQGAMQDLLTARSRLPGFSGEWQSRPLSSVSSFITKGTTPTTYGFGWEAQGILFLRSECVSSRGLDLSQSMFISEETHRAIKRSEVTGGDILITITGNVGRVVRLPNDFGQANINQHIARIRVNSGAAIPDFVFHQLSRPEYLRHFNSIVTGQAYPQISLQQVREAEVHFPEIEEQLAIAEFLNDMDAEIQTLESRLTKARAVKEGMMQNLLTGRVRLV